MDAPAFYQYFIAATKNYSIETDLIESLWTDIVAHYADASRHYHTISHLEAIINELIPIKEKTSNWDIVIL